MMPDDHKELIERLRGIDDLLRGWAAQTALSDRAEFHLENAGAVADAADLIESLEHDAATLERYKTAFSILCFTCSGNGEIEGSLDDQESGGLMLCPDCGGSGRKKALQHAQEQVGDSDGN